MRKASIALAAFLLISACSSFRNQTTDIFATVNYVDAHARRIDVDTKAQFGQSIYYDNSTEVVYRGRNYNIIDLERGDEISVRGYRDHGRYVAQTITVTRNVRG